MEEPAQQEIRALVVPVKGETEAKAPAVYCSGVRAGEVEEDRRVVMEGMGEAVELEAPYGCSLITSP